MDAENESSMKLDSYLEESDEEPEMTCEEVLQTLENAWLNEKFAPELLPHNSYLVDVALQQIAHMEENLKKIDRDDIRKNIHTMEISRIKFIISSYLRKRLEKIEEFANYLLSQDANKSEDNAIMTPEETQFAKEYVSSVQTLFHTVALQFLPKGFSELKLDKIGSKPNFDKHVFVKAKKDIKGVLLSTNEEEDFDEGSQHIIQYSVIAPFLQNGEIQLI